MSEPTSTTLLEAADLPMRVVFMGSPAFALPTLQRLLESDHDVVGVVTQPDRPAGRGRTLRSPPVAEVAREQGIPVLQPKNVNASEGLDQVRALEPDALAIAAYGQILKQALLDIPRRGSVNVHASLLPKYRGAAPAVAALLNGEYETGVTILEVVLALDAGPILAQRSVPIEDEDTTGSLNEKLAHLGGELLAEALGPWWRGELEARPQDEAEASYAPSVKHEDAVIDWSVSADGVWRRVRAYSPWPVANTEVDGELLRILEARPIVAGEDLAAGTVFALPDRAALPAGTGFAVRCGEGALAVVRAQRAGRRPMSGEELLRGYHGLLGRRLGSQE